MWAMAAPQSAALEPFAPRMAVRWLAEAPEERWRQVEGSLAFVDISGFTALTERLSKRADEFTALLQDAGATRKQAESEVKQSIKALFQAAAWASKYEGTLHRPTDGKSIIPALNEHIGVVGIANSRMASRPPGLSTLTISAQARSGCSTFRIPKAIVTASTDWSGSGMRVASPRTSVMRRSSWARSSLSCPIKISCYTMATRRDRS